MSEFDPTDADTPIDGSGEARTDASRYADASATRLDATQHDLPTRRSERETAPTTGSPRERWSAKKSAITAAVAIGLTSAASIGAAAAMPASSSGGGMGGPGGAGGMGTHATGTAQNGQMGPGVSVPGSNGSTAKNGTSGTGGSVGSSGSTSSGASGTTGASGSGAAGTTGGSGTAGTPPQGQMPAMGQGTGQMPAAPGAAAAGNSAKTAA